MTDPEFDVAVDPLGTTTGGLPYPESSAPLNQGANDIKALALALEGRGLGFKSALGYVNAAAFNGGRYTLVLPAGFTAAPYVLLTPYWGGTTGNAPAPLNLNVETASATQVGLIALKPPPPGTPGSTSDWFTGTCGFAWLAWGT